MTICTLPLELILVRHFTRIDLSNGYLRDIAKFHPTIDTKSFDDLHCITCTS